MQKVSPVHMSSNTKSAILNSSERGLHFTPADQPWHCRMPRNPDRDPALPAAKRGRIALEQILRLHHDQWQHAPPPLRHAPANL